MRTKILDFCSFVSANTSNIQIAYVIFFSLSFSFSNFVSLCLCYFSSYKINDSINDAIYKCKNSQLIANSFDLINKTNCADFDILKVDWRTFLKVEYIKKQSRTISARDLRITTIIQMSINPNANATATANANSIVCKFRSPMQRFRYDKMYSVLPLSVRS